MIGIAFDPGGDDVAEARREGIDNFGYVYIEHCAEKG
jgi:hypothetical protein